MLTFVFPLCFKPCGISGVLQAWKRFENSTHHDSEPSFWAVVKYGQAVHAFSCCDLWALYIWDVSEEARGAAAEHIIECKFMHFGELEIAVIEAFWRLIEQASLNLKTKLS